MIFDNVNKVMNNIEKASALNGENVCLVGVTKTRTISEINSLIDSGVTTLGENRVQEFNEKYPELKRDVDWHIIGTLQKNKIKYIIGKVGLIQSVDSLELAKAISQYANKSGVTSDILLQINPSGEETKHGFNPIVLTEVVEKVAELSNLKVRGLMMMAPHVRDEKYLSELFEKTRKIFDNIMKYNAKYDNINMEILSMGMSSDYELAIKCGSNMVRVGTALFE